MRTPREIAFRFRQEVINVWWYAKPPAVAIAGELAPCLPLPDPCGEEVIALAAQVRRHQFSIFGLTIETGPTIRWRRDYTRGIETGLDYFRRIPYLDTGRAGDHKIIWELNRHQHLIVLAQAYLLTGNARNLDEIRAQLESWFVQNPFHRGINWANALEVAFRALSWMWVDQLVGAKLPSEFRKRWLGVLYLHARHLENNLSFYFSPNTHLLGEALALHALGLFFAHAKWEALGAKVMREQMERQVRADGSHFEQSTYYHVYALDMFRLHAALAKPGPAYMAKLERMAEYLRALTGPSGRLPLLGDDDGGRLPTPRIIPSDKWESRLFADAGVVVMTAGNVHAIVKAGGFGAAAAGHSHADALSLVVRSGDDEILIDPGTYTYTGDAHWRDWFRGTGAHNTIRIDGLDQATAAGPFRWINPPQVRVLSWQTNSERDVLDAECRFAGFTHRRRIEFQKPDVFLITDNVDGTAGEHDIEQLWHLGSLAARSRLVLSETAELVESWRSTTFGEKHAAPLLRVHFRSKLPVHLETRIELNR